MSPINEVIDKLTNSIENVKSGESFRTTMLPFLPNDKGFSKGKWKFDWTKESTEIQRQIFKLVTLENPSIIHGLISIEDKGDLIYMHLIENAKFNKGKEKTYYGVAGNLVAFACKTSFEKGYDGFISFTSKSKLIEHYKKSLGAKIFMGNVMIIDTPESFRLFKRYFPDEN
ncbi:hypothetical protein LV89_03928 [Arcicella aurantiaca]|uniref:N-acetyltransferase domain-containing protein n=1 Tax=Arcicella aurantiaca TaxID=591202 RepID=A0A316DP98_9BACT|nr:hypothetical protein [Arcicella aurantiaca]PWK19412.1 hypothetical protein LV89_03928 [Arcicella aurantiaca]